MQNCDLSFWLLELIYFLGCDSMLVSLAYYFNFIICVVSAAYASCATVGVLVTIMVLLL